MISKCSECGFQKFHVLACPVWNTKISCIAWEEAERSGETSQLEPLKKMLVKNTLKNLHDSLPEAMLSHARGFWSNHMRKLDVSPARETERIILADFSATIDLRA